jgi:hypothetical protein
MASSRRRVIADDQVQGENREPQRGSPPAKPGAQRKKGNKGGKATAKRARTARSGVAKKKAGSGSGTDRSRHKRRDKNKTRATSRSPSIGR